jgi:hypothetical protein
VSTAEERARRERLAQGLPERIEDPATLDAIATICRAAQTTPPPHKRGQRPALTAASDHDRSRG